MPDTPLICSARSILIAASAQIAVLVEDLWTDKSLLWTLHDLDRIITNLDKQIKAKKEHRERCPVITTFLENWTYALSESDWDALIKPLVGKLDGTKSLPAIEGKRAAMAADWMIRGCLPAWLRLASLTGQADSLESLPEITSFAVFPSLVPIVEAIRIDARAALAAVRISVMAEGGQTARIAAISAAKTAAYSGLGATAWSAAGYATKSINGAAWKAVENMAFSTIVQAAKAAAFNAAFHAAKDASASQAGRETRVKVSKVAARDALSTTVATLQASALDLVNRMIDAREAEHA